jgi:hypothetical protein
MVHVVEPLHRSCRSGSADLSRRCDVDDLAPPVSGQHAGTVDAFDAISRDDAHALTMVEAGKVRCQLRDVVL